MGAGAGQPQAWLGCRRAAHTHAGRVLLGLPQFGPNTHGLDRTTTSSDRTQGASDGTPLSSIQTPALGAAHAGLMREGAITAATPLQKPVAGWQQGPRGPGSTWVQGQASPRPGSAAGGRHSHMHAGCCWGCPSSDQTGAGSDRTTTSSDRTQGASDGTPLSSIQTPALGAAHDGLKLLAPIAGRPCLWPCPHAARLAPQPQALPQPCPCHLLLHACRAAAMLVYNSRVLLRGAEEGGGNHSSHPLAEASGRLAAGAKGAWQHMGAGAGQPQAWLSCRRAAQPHACRVLLGLPQFGPNRCRF